MNKYKHKLKMPRRPFFPKPSLFATAKEHAISPPDPQTLNDLDKIYLLLCEQNLQEWFNLLCYELRIRNLSVLDKIDDEFLKKFRLIPNFAKEQLKQLFKTAQRTTNYVDLALKYGKTPYRQRLESAGVPLIPVEEIRVVRKVASGPVSGAICDAVWVKPDGKRFRVCLRYDREQSQRLHFLQEAEISASLDHENILHVYGVVLPGSYTNSVALVVDFSAYGNIQEAISQLSVYSLVKITAQLASALRYLESKKLVHFRITAASIFLMAQDKIQLGGMWGCFPENQLRANKTSSESNSLSSEVVFFYGQICKDLFRQLAFHRFGMGLSSKFQQKQKVLCPDVLGALFDKCCSKNANARPSFSQIEKTLSTFALPKLRVTSDISGQSRHDLTCAKDEIILLVSKTVPRWLGENRSGSIGLFDPAKTQETPHFADDEWLLPEEQRGEKGPDSSKTEADNEKDSSVPPEIQARGVEAEHAFQRALKKGKVSVYRGRVMLVGQNRAGKTSLKKSLLGIQFDPGEPSTEGVEVDPSKFEVDTHRVINWQMVKNEKFTSEFAEDIARLVVGELRCPEKEQKSSSLPTTQELPQERVEAPPVEETEEVTTDQSLEGIAVTSLNPVEDFNSDLLEDPELHLDIETSTGVPEDVISLVTKYLQTQQEEQRADTRETVVTIWDFAGQHLYYASHPVFLSPRAVYVLVYNMSKDLNAKMEPCVRQGVHDFIPHSSGDETNLDSILSWLVSIHNLSPEIRGQERRQNNDQPYLRPPVIVVGTHIDRPFEDPKRMEALIKKNLTGKSYEQHVRRPFFRVDNTRSQDEEGVKKLRCEVKEVLNLEPYMGEDVPVRWFNFEKVVEALVQQKTFYLKVAQLYNIVRKVCYIDDETEMAAMLDFYHDLGIIIWHGDTVVLETRWLINLFRKLITIRPFDEQNPRHAAAWNELEQTGLLSMHLVGHVFAEFLCDGQSQSDILGMMEMYGLIAKFTPDSDSDLSQQQSTVKYFVPAQLGSCPQTEVETSAVDVCPLFINFLDGFLPHGLFPQLVSRFIRGSRELGCKDAPNLFQNLVRFIIGKNDLFLICKQSFIKVILRKVSSVSPANDEEGTAALVRESLEKILRSLSRDFPCLRNMRYELCVACPSCPKQNRVCVKHRVASCTHDGCIHLLPITLEERLICTRTFGDQSRVEVPGAEKWQPVNNKRGNTSPVLPDLLPSGEVSDKTDALPEEKPRPEVFISYQWDLQDTVRVLQSKLEEAGFRCWMDIMHMGGGDSLYAEIDAGIRAAKVFISCVTKRYCQSEMCQREVTLADNLRKPIIPLLFEFIQWPPAGQLALIFTKLLYIDMTQGTELLPENKLRELRAKIQGHVEQ